MKSNLEKLHGLDRELRHLEHVSALLQWDQETFLPKAAVEGRSEQAALIEGIAHEKRLGRDTDKLLRELGSTPQQPGGDESLPPIERDFLRVFRKRYDREAALPGDFVRKAAKATGLSQAAWVEARKNSDFAAFLPHLETMINFAREKAVFWGFREQPYDGLLDFFEPGTKAAGITTVFGALRGKLKCLLSRIAAKSPQPMMAQYFDPQKQADLSRSLLRYVGLDPERSRIDTSAHPFTTRLGGRDVRITTRYLSRSVSSGVFSTLHEMGHALYELGIPPELEDSCLGDGASMGIHESQSRLWENVIGRSREFWQGAYPLLVSTFKTEMDGCSLDEFYRGINHVAPSLIRIEADEVSYCLHIILRFELEKRLISGELAAEDLPQAWNALSGEMLGLTPSHDGEGVLQDVHWSAGLFGYFPTYALGNLYGLCFWERLREDLPGVQADIARGNFGALKAWLSAKIWSQGARLLPAELLLAATGSTLSPEPFVSYLEEKYGALYNL